MGGSSIHVVLRHPGLPDFSACNIETERPGYEQTVQPSRYCRDSTDFKACVPNPAYTLVGTTNVPRSACSSIDKYHDATKSKSR